MKKSLTIEEIKNDNLHGASWLAEKAIELIKEACLQSKSSSIDEFLFEIRIIARELMECRPSMVPIANNISRFINELSEQALRENSFESLRDSVPAIADRIIEDLAQARLKVMEIGSKLIHEGDEIATASYSSTIIQTLLLARERGILFRVLVAQSKFGGQSYGEIAAAELTRYGIKNSLIADDDLYHSLFGSTKVMVGADSILADASLINGFPTYKLAMAANGRNIPVYSICESNKFDSFNAILSVEKGFDIIPSNFLTAIVTELGILKPAEIIQYKY